MDERAGLRVSVLGDGKQADRRALRSLDLQIATNLKDLLAVVEEPPVTKGTALDELTRRRQGRSAS
jgi:hypothetical protein